MAAPKVYHAVGKRKSAIARVYLRNGSGAIRVNGKEFNTYFPAYFQPVVRTALRLLDADEKFDVRARIIGGGVAAQADACKHAIAKALLLVSASNRPALKKAGLLSRDSRVVESKKYGHKKARRSFQFSKR